MGLRTRTHARFGTKTGLMLRSVYAVVLGLGGWFFGALLVMTTMPGVPLDDQFLVAGCVGVPIGLGIYYAWVRGDWSVRAKTIGLTAAAGGALMGAWLGFNATEGLLAPLSAIVGAVLGANLAVIGCDIWRDQQLRRFPVNEAQRTLEAVT